MEKRAAELNQLRGGQEGVGEWGGEGGGGRGTLTWCKKGETGASLRQSARKKTGAEEFISGTGKRAQELHNVLPGVKSGGVNYERDKKKKKKKAMESALAKKKKNRPKKEKKD